MTTWDGRSNAVPYASITGASQGFSNGISTQVGFTTVEESTPTGFGDVAGDRLLIPAPGVYLFGGYLEFPANAAGRRNMALLVNGVNVKLFGLPVVAAAVAYLAVSDFLRVDAGDAVTLTVVQTSGALLTAGTHRLAGIRLAL